MVTDLLDWQKTINATLNTLPTQLQQQMGDNLDQHLVLLRVQLENARQDMLQAVSEDQRRIGGLGQRLGALEEVSGFVADAVTAPRPDAAQMAAALRGIVTALSQINSQLHDFDTRLPTASGAATPPAEQQQPVDPAEQQKVDQALTAVTDIFSSLRDRGDNVISRLNQMASHLQSAADKIQRD